MRRAAAVVCFFLLPAQALARDQLRKFRWAAGEGRPEIFLGARAGGGARALPGVGETVISGVQLLGEAEVPGTWRQEIRDQSGKVAYMAGAVLAEPPAQASLRFFEAELAEALKRGMAGSERLRGAGQIFPPTLEVRKNEEGEWQPYWRVEYLTAGGDRLRYLLLGSKGESLGEGELDWQGVDGRAMVFPKGPRLSPAQEMPLRELSGDGTVSGRLIRVFSALGLQVWSPEFTFFFPQDDRRFDLGQAYFTVEEAFRWLRDRLGVEIDRPVDVRLHVGEGGVSNAAFYHQNVIFLGTGDGITYKDLIRDPSVLVHEAIHAVIDAYAGLPSEGEGGAFNEGFADLFAALILENPRMGEASYLKGPFRRTLENAGIAYRDFKPGVYQNGSIVGATFWDMKPLLGTELTAKLAFRTMVRLGRGARFDDLPSALASAAEGLLSAGQKEQALAIARKRGWRVP